MVNMIMIMMRVMKFMVRSENNYCDLTNCIWCAVQLGSKMMMIIDSGADFDDGDGYDNDDEDFDDDDDN